VSKEAQQSKGDGLYKRYQMNVAGKTPARKTKRVKIAPESSKKKEARLPTPPPQTHTNPPKRKECYNSDDTKKENAGPVQSKRGIDQKKKKNPGLCGGKKKKYRSTRKRWPFHGTVSGKRTQG